MKNLKFLGWCLLIVLFNSCAPKITTSISKRYSPLDARAPVKVFGLQDTVPKKCEELGVVKIGDTGFTINCNYNIVLEDAKLEARKIGGDAIKIIQHVPPNFGSSCHRIVAKILKFDAQEKDSLATVNAKTDYPIPEEYPLTRKSSFQRVRFGISGGWSYRTAKIGDNVSADLRRYLKDLKSGFHAGADFSYFISEPLGIGLRYSFYRSANKADIVVTDSSGAVVFGKLRDNVSIHFVGPALFTRILSRNKKNTFNIGLSLGYMGYMDNATLIDDFTITGGTFGMVMDLGFDVGLSKNVALGFLFSYTLGTLSQYKFDDGITKTTVKLDEDSREGLGRIDLGLVLRFSGCTKHKG